MRLHIFCNEMVANRLELAARIASRMDSKLKMVAREAYGAATAKSAPF